MRNVQKSIEEFKEKFCGTKEARFFLSDFRQLMELSRDITQADTCVNLADNAFMLGYMAGRRKGLKEARNKKKSACR